MKFYVQIRIFFCYLLILSVLATQNELSSARESRQLIGIRIPAENCSSFIDGYSEGYCDGIASCISHGGYFGGFCFSGLGMCCVVKKSCGETVRTRIAYFRNRGHPARTDADGECEIVINRYYTDVTQVRIDFIDFDLEEPSSSGSCSEESFTVSGNDPRFAIPTICGENEGKHMYVNFENTETATLTLKVKLSGSRSSSFNIKVTQYRCNHPDKAPDGCLQYYREPNDIIESFNYGTSNQNIQNQFYEACIDKNAIGSTILWTFTSLNLFSVASNPTPTGDDCVAGGSYVCIPGGKTYPSGIITSSSTSTDKLFYCSSSSATVVSTSYKIQVVLGPDAASLTGFKVRYEGSSSSNFIRNW